MELSEGISQGGCEPLEIPKGKFHMVAAHQVCFARGCIIASMLLQMLQLERCCSMGLKKRGFAQCIAPLCPANDSRPAEKGPRLLGTQHELILV